MYHQNIFNGEYHRLSDDIIFHYGYVDLTPLRPISQMIASVVDGAELFVDGVYLFVAELE
jgi:hypothetical protein